MRVVALLALLAACQRDPADTDPDPGSDTDSDSDSDSDTDTDTDSGADDGRFFPAGSPWYEDVSGAPVDPSSDELIAALQDHGWGLGRFQMDFSIEVLEADAGTPRRDFEPTGDFYEPDCDHVAVPVPPDGNLEGEEGYACEGDGDCHLIVAERDEGLLYEMWRADLRGDDFQGGCLAVWDMTRVYPPEGRGEQCTSADAAGYPLAPLLMTADEVAAGEIPHALRFALPNSAIRDGWYHHPASHATNAGGGGEDAIPYGARLRLRADFDTSRVADPEALVVVEALQRYGMFLADGGSVTLMGRSDRRAAAKWAELFEEDLTHALVGIEPADFEVIELEPPAVELTFDCVRSE